MILNLGSLAFNANIDSGGGTPAWGTELGQGEGYKFAFEDMSDFFIGMVYKSIPDMNNVTCPLGKGGNQRADYDFVIASIFDKVYVNGNRINDARFLLLIVKKLNGDHHVGRRTIKYNPRMTYCGEYINEDCYRKMTATMGLPEDAAWFVYEIYIANQDELHFTAFELGQEPQSYRSNDERKNAFINRLPKDGKRSYKVTKRNEAPLQQIYYGAPGTGKSHEINRLTEGEEVIRTTFHPDSDYSTFVGCYKPHMEEVDMTTVIGKELIVVKDESGQPKKEKRIVYKYSCQAFLQAYIAAWQHPDKAQYLVIEEINRGNCAQIFGDMFQLLDRNDGGYSAYPIKTDADAEDELRTLFAKEWNLSEEKAKEIDDLYRKHYPDGITKSIKDGSILLLPSNLYIWATMNTSDQSLFPIDSAFKRRWDWKYVKIAEGRDSETKVLLNWLVKFDYEKDNKSYTFECSWWKFIKTINEKIAAATSSDDKKLGYFFCKPKTQDSKEIDAERFVGKVVFYLWNDVFKDEDNAIFKVVEGKGDPSFDTFYMEDEKGKTIADTKALRAFMHNVFGEQSNLYTETAKETTDTVETVTE